ncbi:MAG: 16S rRNA (guanine(527)-N(7))-methyltransferase RsmG [Spirochaetales bacterium]|uniref:Ribosomal RNA small subunit methyltransferase G n=1 Tax=Candidatus Thalassospirochaeta sargassi TaxID=3119039 RepID=A0AAJ1IJK6_9SPIO|nr:16S rRNA (guanine(527)-N(7))-methyltransferase RsmG [Spirochaetales bacterium]
MMNKLNEGIKQLGLEVSDEESGKLEIYINELLIWNAKLNLVSARDGDQLIVRHILDCLAGLEYIRSLEGEHVGDLGSGAGLPGMIMAIFMKDRRFTLVERSGKKAGFLRSTAALLGLVDRLQVADTDLRNIKTEFDIVTLRAFRDFGDFYGEIKKVTSRNGCIAAYKGRVASIRYDLDSAKLSSDAAEIRPLRVPFLDEERHMLIIHPW